MDDEVYMDDWGNYFDASGRQLDIYDLIARGIDVAGAYAGRSPYISPDDPRYRNQRGGWFPQSYPGQGVPPGSAVPGAVNPQGFQMSWWAAGLIGVIAGAFLLGKRGR